MKLLCSNYFSLDHDKINLSKDISCCLSLLLEKYDESELYSLHNSYGGFLVRTLNHYYKKINYNISEENTFFSLEDQEMNIKLLDKLINIITHYSIILLQHEKKYYAKLICSLGIDLINFSNYKYDKNLIRKKGFLLNNLSFVYLSEKRYLKSEIFIDKCIEINKTSLDNIITYNNFCMINIKKLKGNQKLEKKEIKKIIDDIIYYLYLGLKELKKRIINKYKNELIHKEEIDKQKNNKENYFHKKEITCFLFYNCFYIMKFFDEKEFNKNYNYGLKIIQRLLGTSNYIYVKMVRINNNDINKILIEDILKEKENTNDNSFDIDFKE